MRSILYSSSARKIMMAMPYHDSTLTAPGPAVLCLVVCMCVCVCVRVRVCVCECVMHVNVLSHTHEGVMSQCHVRMSHVKHINKSPTDEWGMSHMNASSTEEGVESGGQVGEGGAEGEGGKECEESKDGEEKTKSIQLYVKITSIY